MSSDPEKHWSGVELFGLTSEEFVDKFSGKIILDRLGGRDGAMAAYRRMFRNAELSAPGPNVGTVEVPPVVEILREDCAEGEVVKFLTRIKRDASGDASGGAGRLPDDVTIESVLIPMIGTSRVSTYTLCVSSQVGCAMGCGFCETAQMGLIRSLTAGEIVSQWFHAVHTIGIRPKNLVFMGMGEPMDNYDNVMQAVSVLKDHNGPHVALSSITISTVGRIDGIRKMAEQIKKPGWHRLQLALSLNASNDTVRDSIMPVNRKWNIEDLKRELQAWPKFAGNKLCIEYVLIPGVNDSVQHLDELAIFMAGFREERGKPRGVLNLIPYNPRRNSPWPAPDEAHVIWFLQGLIDRGVFAKRRRTKGREMMGACGQLGSEHIRHRRLIAPTISAPPTGPVATSA
ncbi:MAG: 23S rRNA (adenine(2503)-C(2))-methyltransferase RlmN [bacterium]|nr:23S rRNA (adenine(2503)-C(2))-methyltransferase RlmN [bacterium]